MIESRHYWWLLAGSLVCTIYLGGRMRAIADAHPAAGLAPTQIALELTWSPSRAQDLLIKWGPEGRALVTRQIRLDFFYIPAYVLAIACAVSLAGIAYRTSSPSLAALSTPLLVATVSAGFLDLIENALLLRALGLWETGLQPVASLCAHVKFALLIGAVAYSLTPAIGWVLRQVRAV